MTRILITLTLFVSACSTMPVGNDGEVAASSLWPPDMAPSCVPGTKHCDPSGLVLLCKDVSGHWLSEPCGPDQDCVPTNVDGKPSAICTSGVKQPCQCGGTPGHCLLCK